MESSVTAHAAVNANTNGADAKPEASAASVITQSSPLAVAVTRTLAPAGGSSTTCVLAAAGVVYAPTTEPSSVNTTT